MSSSTLLGCLQGGHYTGRPIFCFFPIQTTDTGELYHFIKEEKTILAVQVSDQTLKMQSIGSKIRWRIQ